MIKTKLKLGSRKVVRLNTDGTLTMSLPRVWVQSIDLKAGDLLDISIAENGALIITPRRGAPQTGKIPSTRAREGIKKFPVVSGGVERAPDAGERPGTPEPKEAA